MSDANQELMLEILKDVQRRIGGLESGLREVRISIVELREKMLGMSGRILSCEKSILGMDDRLQRIKKRLDLIKA